MTFTAAVTLLACRQSAGHPVTLTLQAMPVPRALAELSRATRMRLESSKATDLEVVALRFDHVRIEDALKRFADCVDAIWIPRNGGLLLSRTPEALKEADSRDISIAAESIQRSIGQHLQGFAKTEIPPKEFRRRLHAFARAIRIARADKSPAKIDEGVRTDFQSGVALLDGAPSRRAFTAVLPRLNPLELASIPFNSRRVWATCPTDAQSKLAPETETGLRRLVEQDIRFTDEFVEAMTDPTKSAAPGPDWSDLRSGTGQAIVAATNDGRSINLDLVVANNDGVVGLRDSTELVEVGPEDPAWIGTAADEELAVPPLAAELARQGSKADHEPISGVLQNTLLHAAETDPLAISVSPLLIQVAERLHRNLVACIPDVACAGLRTDAGNRMTVGMYISRLCRDMGMRTSADPDWLVVRPAMAARSRSDRVDRSTLSRYLREHVSGEPVTIEREAEWAQEFPAENGSGLRSQLLALIAPEWASQSLDPDLLRLYGSFSPDEQVRMQRTGIRLGSLNLVQRTILESMVFGSKWGLQPPETDFDDMQEHGRRGEQLMEPTQLFPYGLPPDGVLRLKDSGELVDSYEDAPATGAKLRPAGLLPGSERSGSSNPAPSSSDIERTLRIYVDLGSVAELYGALKATVRAAELVVPDQHGGP